MIGGVIDHMQKHLPHKEHLVFFWFLDRLGEQHIVLQHCKIRTDLLFHVIPVGANDFTIV